ncbi:MAG: hypothetical protein MIO92_16690, partial [Methanosarcinaceae archaeon]|nr:hypothetical protein [Methanosarcinaceae archaeon]
PMVAFTDNIKDAIHLVRDMVGYAHGIYIGVQPRPLCLFDKAPNRWEKAISKPGSNCACDNDIEYITACFWDIDVVSVARKKGHPASEEELLESLDAAYHLSGQTGLALTSTICFSGNGHYVVSPIVPLKVDNTEIPQQLKAFCTQAAMELAGYYPGIAFDPVFNLSRVMRIMGTNNLKGIPIKDRTHHTASFVTEPIISKSMALHHMIQNVEVPTPPNNNYTCLSKGIKCDLLKIAKCNFIQWCRDSPEKVTEPLWFALATNLAHLEGGPELFHEISILDEDRYDYQQVERLLERVLKSKFGAVSCESLKSRGYCCKRVDRCIAKAPMYLGYLYVKWNKSNPYF